MNSDKPFSVESFLEKLAANDPEVLLDPATQAGLQKLAQTMRRIEGARPHILLIDDDDADVLLLERALQENGVPVGVSRVRDGFEALDYFAGNHPYTDRTRFPLPLVTFLDLKMPGMNGVDTLRRMRELPDCGQLLVIVLTISDEEKDMENVGELNVSAYLLKPPTHQELEKLVRQVKVSWIDPILTP